MKRITLGSFFILTLMLCQLVSAQDSNKRSVKIQNQDIELNEINQRFYNETGVIRCLTDEIDEKRRQQNPNLGTKQEFEKWLAPLISDYKSNKLAQKNAGAKKMATYNVPVIFHVVTGAAGDANDLSQALVNAQIDQINIDFSNGAGANAGPWAAVASSVDIQFVPAQIDPMGNALAEPGINRVYGYPGNLTPAQFDNTIKPATIWDRTLYANIWTGSLDNNLLGYAQFPEGSTLPGIPNNGGVNTDGVVCLASSIGSVAMPNPAGGNFGSGRTLTHELGHWLGLFHIWGDGDCNADDACADTPNQGNSSTGCPITNDTCTMDTNTDMVQNYLDYSDDACMNIFTIDQVARIVTVLNNSPGRTELSSSTTGNTTPTINFGSIAVSQLEGSDCAFTEVNVPVVIGAGASSNADVTFALSGGTATNNVDFEIVNTTVSFAAGSTVGQNLTLKIFNDNFIEGDETFTIDLSVNGNGGNASAGPNNSLTFTITDDDFVVSNLIVETLFTEDFTNGAGSAGFVNFDEDGNATDNWQLTTEMDQGWGIYNGEFLVSFSWFNGATTPDNYLVTPLIAIPAGSTNVELSYFIGSGNDPMFINENYEVYVSSSRDTAADVLAGTRVVDENLQDFLTGAGGQIKTIDLSAFVGQSVYISFRHHNSTDNFALGIDDILVTRSVETSVQTAVNAATKAESNLISSGGQVYNLDTVSQNIMTDLNITDNSDYGCTTIEVSRSGASGQSFQGSVSPALVTDKTFTITPTTDNATGTSEISFYFTEAELAGWEAATSDNRSNLRIAKDNGSTVTEVASTITAFGSNWKVTGNFANGIGGTYYFGNTGAFLSTSRFTFDAFAMYPNPSNNEVTIKFNTTDNVAINLFDINGRTVLSKVFKNQTSSFNQNLNVSALAGGIYIVKIKSGSNTMFRKLVIN